MEPDPGAPAPPREGETGGEPRRKPTRIESIGKAIGCAVLAFLIAMIAVALGVFDLFF